MMDVLKVFSECAEQVNDEFQEADASERLWASVGLVELGMRARWEERQLARQSPMESMAAMMPVLRSVMASGLELCRHHHGEGEELPPGVEVASCIECQKIYAVDADMRARMKEAARASVPME